MSLRLNRIIGRLLATSAICISTLECSGASAQLSKAHLTDIWRQEFSLPANSRPAIEASTSTVASSFSTPNQFRTNHPHPAVVRVIVPEEGATSYGSGTLVDLRDQFGLVITNWHVVRDAKGMVEVEFPGGFKSQARSLKVDPDWDLAALVIWRPPVEPVVIAEHAPQPGDLLTICGYGQGMYRSATGRCTQYYAPRLDFPRHMVELDVEARQGDSGGPIFNQQGELAGVLFGAGEGTTLGSFGGRVDSFLASLAPDIGQQVASQPAKMEEQPPVCNQICRPDGTCTPCEHPAAVEQEVRIVAKQPPAIPSEDDGWNAPSQVQKNVAAMWPKEEEQSEQTVFPASAKKSESKAEVAGWQPVKHSGRFEQMKNILAAIGLVSIAVLILRAAR